MLGHGPLGVLALGQLPSTPAGDAAAAGAILSLSLSLVAGAASGIGQLPPILVSGGLPYGRDAVARGARLDLRVSLDPGIAIGVRRIDAAAAGATLRFATGIVAGSAEGDMTGDNDFLLLAA